MSDGQNMQEYLSNFQKILTDLFSITEKVEEKTRTLVLLSSLLSSFEFLVTSTSSSGKATMIVTASAGGDGEDCSDDGRGNNDGCVLFDTRGGDPSFGFFDHREVPPDSDVILFLATL